MRINKNKQFLILSHTIMLSNMKMQLVKQHYSILSNPVYFFKIAGKTIPSDVWLFSSKQAIILGNDRELPFNVCTNIYLNLSFWCMLFRLPPFTFHPSPPPLPSLYVPNRNVLCGLLLPHVVRQMCCPPALVLLHSPD